MISVQRATAITATIAPTRRGGGSGASKKRNGDDTDFSVMPDGAGPSSPAPPAALCMVSPGAADLGDEGVPRCERGAPHPSRHRLIGCHELAVGGRTTSRAR